MTLRPKRLYLVRRNPSLTREEFPGRWMRHGDLSLSFQAKQGFANVYRYLLCPVMQPQSGKGPEHGGNGVADGVGMLFFRDEAARERHHASAAQRAAMEADEDETFAERVNGTSLFVVEQVALDGPLTPFLLTTVLRRRPHVTPQAFEAWWNDVHVHSVLRAAPALRRFVGNIPMEDGSGDLQADLIEELWFVSFEDLRRTLEDTAFAETRGALLEQCDVVSRLESEVRVLHDADPGPT
ncbi:EthD domain-containing protein [Roseomonas populi]|uniref:EthD domain-containing protein n=1 Tax=Roseomonas populi TaxID=3121582 RepID=A0ABT1WZ50_9PROT|nr:EthD domain-containing protein [Roseomonas pecuniae]MCR0981130.1 EthD domain-containing protein [Roseomonas pecuniae]